MFRLETDRLIIRPWTDDDRPSLSSIMEDPVVTQYVHGGLPFTPQEIDDFLARQVRQLGEHGVCMGALAEKESGRVVGIAGIQPLGTTGDLEIGWILSRDSWGRGYATEAGQAVRDHVLLTLGRPRVVAIIDLPNEASKRVAGRLGMRYEGQYTGVQLGHRKPEIVVDLFFCERHVSVPA